MPMRSMSVSLPNKSPLQDFRHSIGCLSGTELPSSALSQADVIPLTGEYWAVSANAYRWRLSYASSRCLISLSSKGLHT